MSNLFADLYDLEDEIDLYDEIDLDENDEIDLESWYTWEDRLEGISLEDRLIELEDQEVYCGMALAQAKAYQAVLG